MSTVDHDIECEHFAEAAALSASLLAAEARAESAERRLAALQEAVGRRLVFLDDFSPAARDDLSAALAASKEQP